MDGKKKVACWERFGAVRTLGRNFRDQAEGELCIRSPRKLEPEPIEKAVFFSLARERSAMKRRNRATKRERDGDFSLLLVCCS